MNKQTISKPKTAKSYPRRCGECGKVAVRSAKAPYTAKIKHDGKLHEFRIAKLPIDQCEACKEEFFTNVSSDAKSDALREHLGLLQPTQIRELLAKHKLTQRKFAAHLRVAEESVSRWLNGLSIQSRALDTLMRIYFANEEVRKMLASDEPICLETTELAISADTICFETQSSTEIHQIFGRRFSRATIRRSQRFQLTPSMN